MPGDIDSLRSIIKRQAETALVHLRVAHAQSSISVLGMFRVSAALANDLKPAIDAHLVLPCLSAARYR